MILVFELVWTGTYHAPGNSATIRTIARAFPGQGVRVFADASHLTELRADPTLTVCPNVSLTPVVLSPHFRFRPQIVSPRRAATEFATMRAALRNVRAGEPCLIMLLSATPTAIFAASLLARLSKRPIGIQVGLHGNLNDAFDWRPRNPLIRHFDLHAALGAAHGGRVRFLMLENAIRRALAERAPTAYTRTDVLAHPINQAEVINQPDATPMPPIRIGLVGQATEAKGITPFLALAAHFQQINPHDVSFHLVGRAPDGSDLARFSPLADPISTEHWSREAFLARLGSLHYVCLPLQPEYYELSASGALIDAITWLKPVIATKLPIVRDLFDGFGDIGVLCDDVESMRAAIASLIAVPDPAHYEAQREALRAARDSRTPDTLAREYRALVHQGFPGLLPRGTQDA